MLTRRDMERLFQVRTTTFYVWMREGRVPNPLPLTGHPRWAREEVRRWLTDRASRPGERRLRRAS